METLNCHNWKHRLTTAISSRTDRLCDGSSGEGQFLRHRAVTEGCASRFKPAPVGNNRHRRRREHHDKCPDAAKSLVQLACNGTTTLVGVLALANGLRVANTMPEFELLRSRRSDRPGKAIESCTFGFFATISPMRLITSSVVVKCGTVAVVLGKPIRVLLVPVVA